ncbi:MAG TPA: hypothetical protein VF339_07160 [Gammaproteobacteria bacterium]
MNELRRLVDPTLIVVSVVYGAALVIARTALIFGIWLGMLILLSIARYAYEVLRTAAQGRSRLPAPGIETMNPAGELSFILHFVFFAGLAVVLANPPLAQGSPWIPVARLALVVVVFSFPASAALLAITRSLAAALDPRYVVALIRDVGRAYAAVPAIGVGVGLVAVVLDGTGRLGGLLAVPVSIYGVFAVFFTTGLVLHAVRDVVEIPGEKEPEDEYAERRRHREWQSQLDAAYASIRSGLVEQGYRTIRALVEGEGWSDAVYRWVLQQMLGWEDRAHARAFGAGYVDRLLATDRRHAALELAAHLRDDEGRITVSEGAATALAEYAESIGRYRLADELRGLGYNV